MNTIQNYTATLKILTRLPSSTNGNPRYLIDLDGHKVRTGVDSMIAYCITNHDGKECKVSVGMHYGYPTLTNIERS